MSKQSGGLMPYRLSSKGLEVLLGHPGGPFYARKDNGVWSIPKGEFEDGEAIEAAKREFMEETGAALPEGEYIELGMVKTKGGKTIYAWAVEDDLDPTVLRSNPFSLKWPPKSGQEQEFPEIDKFEWFSLAVARQKITSAQEAFLDRLAEHLNIQKEPRPEQVSLL